jgi:palmitoyltransferase ZDHHC9/14/18
MASPKKEPQSPPRASAEPSTFPNPTDITENRRPMSVASSCMTDEFTDYGDNSEPQLATNVAAHSGHASRVPDPGSRPSSAQTGLSSRGGWSAATPHGRIPPTSYAGSVGSPSTRPPTSQSRTHVSTVTAPAFYRPMSSQRLQAQRGQRREPNLPQATLGRESLEEDRQGQQTVTISGAQRKPSRPLSRGTDISDLAEAEDDVPAVPILPGIPDRVIRTASPTNSEAALQRSEKPVPGHLDIGRSRGPNVAPPPKSPRSFRSSLIPSRNGRHSRGSFQGRLPGHEKLPSNASTPNIGDEAKAAVRKELRKNYEYFAGNTIFCLGGRLQNTRDRPINLITGFLILLPIVLFFAFS